MEKAKAWKDEANSFYKSGKLQEAEKKYLEALEALPADDESEDLRHLKASLYSNIAAVQISRGQTKTAVENSVKAALADESFTRAYQRLGNLCTNAESFSAALEAAKTNSSSMTPSKIFDVLNIVHEAKEQGNLKFKEKQFAEAKTAYSSGLEKALAALQKIVSEVLFVPGAAILLCNRAACNSELDEPKAAIEDVTHALQINPNYVRARMRRAAAYRKDGNLQQALADLKELRIALPGNKDVTTDYNAVASELGEPSQEKPGVIHINSGEQYKKLVSHPGITFVDFYADWCGPCKSISPLIEKIALTYPESRILKVNVDSQQAIAASESIQAMPTFKLFRNGILVEEFRGADPRRIQNALLALHSSR